jgi:MFS family permease
VFPLPLAWTAVVLGVAGLGMITTMVNSNTTVQLLAPDHLRGRIMSVYSMVLLGVGPLGAYLSGLLLQNLGGHWGAAVLGALTLVSGLIMLRSPWPQTVKLTTPTPAAADD